MLAISRIAENLRHFGDFRPGNEIFRAEPIQKFDGRFGGDPVMAPLLIGLGMDELSAAPPLVPPVKFIIRRLKMAEAQELAKFALECESAAEILGKCQELAHQIAPSLFEDGMEGAK